IRDSSVTGVQTCALPIFGVPAIRLLGHEGLARVAASAPAAVVAAPGRRPDAGTAVGSTSLSAGVAAVSFVRAAVLTPAAGAAEEPAGSERAGAERLEGGMTGSDLARIPSPPPSVPAAERLP